MQLAILSCYEAIIDGINKGSSYLSLSSHPGWSSTQQAELVMKLLAIYGAEQTIYTSTHALSERLKEAEPLLSTLTAALYGAGRPVPEPSPETSFRYSASVSYSSSLTWQYNSGGVWVTANSSYKVPGACPSSNSKGSGYNADGCGPGKYAVTGVKRGAKKAPVKSTKKRSG